MGKMEVSHFLFLAITAFLVTTAAAQVVDCPSELSTIDLPFDAEGHTCQAVWTKHDYILAYKRVNDSVWSFVLTAPNNNVYIGIGFSDTGMMVGSSAIVGWPTSDGSGKAWQYYLGGFAPSSVKPNEGNLTLVGENATIIVESGKLYVAFQLQVQAGERPKERLLYALGPDTLPGADNLLQHHADRINTTIDYDLAGATADSAPGPSGPPASSAGVLNSDGFMVTILCAVAAIALGMMRLH